jgi:hypothetical protein
MLTREDGSLYFVKQAERRTIRENDWQMSVYYYWHSLTHSQPQINPAIWTSLSLVACWRSETFPASLLIIDLAWILHQLFARSSNVAPQRHDPRAESLGRVTVPVPITRATNFARVHPRDPRMVSAKVRDYSKLAGQRQMS